MNSSPKIKKYAGANPLVSIALWNKLLIIKAIKTLQNNPVKIKSLFNIACLQTNITKPTINSKPVMPKVNILIRYWL